MVYAPSPPVRMPVLRGPEILSFSRVRVKSRPIRNAPSTFIDRVARGNDLPKIFCTRMVCPYLAQAPRIPNSAM